MSCLWSSFVDVRDAADLHLLAMTRPEANGERFLAVADGTMTLQVGHRNGAWRMGSRAEPAPGLVLRRPE